MKFTELNLHDTLQKAIDHIGYTELTPIQEQSIPHSLEGTDLTGLAQTGTGKTLAFLIPSLNALIALEEVPKEPRVLILAPTRELVLQISEEAKKLLQFTSHTVATIIGGTDYKTQEKEIEGNAAVMVATPGRLLDFIKTRHLDVTQVTHFILDEADRMLDMGFVMDIKYLLHRCKNRKQTMLFSATLSSAVIQMAGRYQEDPLEVHINPEKIITENIDQKLLHLGREEKMPYLVNLILNASVS